MNRLLLLVLLSTTLATSACTRNTGPLPSIQPSEDIIPTPASSLIGGFTWQTDGFYGYRMLRPAGWSAVNVGPGRGYGTPDFSGTADRLLLRVVNYQLLPGRPNGIVAQKQLFEQNPSLEAWTAGIERLWQSNKTHFSLLRTLPQAKIYLVQQPGAPDLDIVAYAVDQNQPLCVDLTASGSYANLGRLQSEGVVDDFAAMVESLRAIPYDPANVVPTVTP